MATNSGFITAPTLLVGLGGIGSSLVDSIYQLLPENSKESIAVLSFDTNVNDISKLKLPQDNIFQTSTSKPVWKYVMNNNSVMEWFPWEIQEIMAKMMTDGAGQVRAVSRLAFRSCIEDFKVSKVDDFINSLFTVHGSRFTGNIRVVIISSLAGGTGAGIFLQTAYYLKDKLANKYARPDSKIVGVFILPDMLVNTGIIGFDQVKNVSANAYACIKELNAIIVNRLKPGFAELELDFKPDMKDAEGHIDHRLPRHVPYDYCYLFDFENAKNENLKHFEYYLEQIRNTIHIDLFSPIAPAGFSQKDNTIITLINQGGLNRYCGAGSSTISYPFDHLTYYVSLRWTYENIKDKWLKIDNDIRKEFSDYRKAIEKGERRTEPDEGKIFRQRMEQYATGASSDPFFKWTYKSAWIIGEDDELKRTKASEFLTRFENEMRTRVERDKILSKLNSECENLDENQLQKLETATDELEMHERVLKNYQKAIWEYIDTNRNYFLNQALFADIEEPNYQTNLEYRFNTYALKKNNPVHPLTVRFMLYEVREILEKRLKQLISANRDTLDGIERYPKAFDLDETEDFIEKPYDRIQTAREQNFIGKLFNNKFKDFIDTYQSVSKIHLAKLNEYKVNYLTELVYGDLLIQINAMIDTWKRFFNNLDDVNLSFKRELNNLVAQHDNDNNPTNIYILASKELKEKIYEKVEGKMHVSMKDFPEDLNQQFYYTLFEEAHCSFKNVPNRKKMKTSELIKDKIVAWYRDNKVRYEDSVNLNCIQAILLEAELLNMDPETHLSKIITKANEIAQPYTPIPSVQNINWITSWGINPECTHSATVSLDLINTLFKEGTLVENEWFSKYQIIREKVLYNLKIDEFYKFSPGNENQNPGSYYMHYKDKCRRLETEPLKEITPHLDKRWHQAAYLPDIHEERSEKDRTNIRKALINGLIIHKLVMKDQHGKFIWQHQGNDGSRVIHFSDRKECPPYIHSLYIALHHNGLIVDRILSQLKELKAEDKRIFSVKGNFRQTGFYKLASQGIFYGNREADLSILDLLLLYPSEDPSEADLEAQGLELIKELVTCIYEYYKGIMGDYTNSKIQANKLIVNMIKSSQVYRKSDKGYQSNAIDSINKLMKK